ncbi:MAG TPA: hypothetical protein VGO68_12515 [Pyrinomonadaceae bacterium]|jgi:hypothetical protein|nr:hypothetical protein [Pyrinomonadaceae bacterium]
MKRVALRMIGWRLIFTCCHPSLAPEARVALTLRDVCGLIAKALDSISSDATILVLGRQGYETACATSSPTAPTFSEFHLDHRVGTLGVTALVIMRAEPLLIERIEVIEPCPQGSWPAFAFALNGINGINPLPGKL